MEYQKYLVEFVGTAFFIFVILISGNLVPPMFGQKSSFFQPFVIAAGLLVAILVGGERSGGHFNPAVSLVMYVAKKLDQSDLLPYIGSQLFGGLVAYHIYKNDKLGIDSA